MLFSIKSCIYISFCSQNSLTSQYIMRHMLFFMKKIILPCSIFVLYTSYIKDADDGRQ